MTDHTTASHDIERLAVLFERGPLAVITGAGLSTASGIPAYRDRHGDWRQRQPIQHQAFMASEVVRRRYWARSLVGWPVVSQAQPSNGHLALTRLWRASKLATLITQNVDGLHQKSGCDEVIELHGGIHGVRCMACAQTYARSLVQQWLEHHNPAFEPGAAESTRSAPDGDADLEDACYADFQVPACPACTGILKPDVVFFGDNVPKERVTRAMGSVEQASGLLVVGSSLTVYSGYRFADLAHRLGKPLIAINQGVTRADPILNIKIEEDCNQALVQLCEALSLPTSDPA
ncbi:MAG: NAD-dependent protein deacetylase [Aquabacterium sp.]|nr:NAD-dependent protein deacetylase [Aquabacterium sp.]